MHGVIDTQLGCKELSRLWRPLTRVVEDPQLTQATAQMQQKVEIFEKLRQALAIALPQGKSSLNRGFGRTPYSQPACFLMDFRVSNKAALRVLLTPAPVTALAGNAGAFNWRL